MISIAARLATKNLTLEAAAEKAGMTAERFQQVASGAKATLGEMRGVAKALQVPVMSLIERTPSEPIQMLFRQTLDQRRTVKVASHVDVLSSQIHDALAVARGLPSDLSWLDSFKGLKPEIGRAHV